MSMLEVPNFILHSLVAIVLGFLLSPYWISSQNSNSEASCFSRGPQWLSQFSCYCPVLCFNFLTTSSPLITAACLGANPFLSAPTCQLLPAPVGGAVLSTKVNTALEILDARSSHRRFRPLRGSLILSILLVPFLKKFATISPGTGLKVLLNRTTEFCFVPTKNQMVFQDQAATFWYSTNSERALLFFSFPTLRGQGAISSISSRL